MDPQMEDRIMAGFDHTERGLMIKMSPQVIDITCRQIANQVRLLTQAGHKPVIVVGGRIRAALRVITQNALPDLKILSHSEITRQTSTVSVGLVSDPVTKA
jgi:flagellar biosynthesis protein FlhA